MLPNDKHKPVQRSRAEPGFLRWLTPAGTSLAPVAWELTMVEADVADEAFMHRSRHGRVRGRQLTGFSVSATPRTYA